MPIEYYGLESLANKRPSDGDGPGWYAISVHNLFRQKSEYQYLRKNHKPVDKVGYSIYIYHITLDEVNRVRRELGLRELPKD